MLRVFYSVMLAAQPVYSTVSCCKKLLKKTSQDHHTHFKCHDSTKKIIYLTIKIYIQSKSRLPQEVENTLCLMMRTLWDSPKLRSRFLRRGQRRTTNPLPTFFGVSQSKITKLINNQTCLSAGRPLAGFTSGLKVQSRLSLLRAVQVHLDDLRGR